MPCFSFPHIQTDISSLYVKGMHIPTSSLFYPLSFHAYTVTSSLFSPSTHLHQLYLSYSLNIRDSFSATHKNSSSITYAHKYLLIHLLSHLNLFASPFSLFFIFTFDSTLPTYSHLLSVLYTLRLNFFRTLWDVCVCVWLCRCNTDTLYSDIVILYSVTRYMNPVIPPTSKPVIPPHTLPTSKNVGKFWIFVS